MPRALFAKKGSAIYISHLDLMRLFQRAFQRAGLKLTHSQGFNPRPLVSIALPLSLGVESGCELLDFQLEGEQIPNETLLSRLNAALPVGVEVLAVYNHGRKLKELALLESILTLEYDRDIPQDTPENIRKLFAQKTVLVEKKGKNGTVVQDLIPMIKQLAVRQISSRELELRVLGCCQNPTLNPLQLCAAIRVYLPELAPDFTRCRRVEIYDQNKTIFR